MHTIGKSKLIRQTGGQAAFGEVWLSAEPADKFSISFDACDALEKCPNGEARFATAVAFGIRVAEERIRRVDYKLPNYRVSVLRIYSTEVDSTEGFLALVASQAFVGALGRKEEPMKLEADRGVVIVLV